MNIQGFTAALFRQLQQQIPRAHLKNEGQFERKHVVEPAWELSKKHPEIRVFVHPENRKMKCRGGCDAGATDPPRRVQGCPDCWKASKKWSVVEVFGTQNNFDLVAIDRKKKTLAVEVKWLSLAGGKGPNSEFQRFIGQCALAAAVHDVVIGVCGFWGQRNRQLDKHNASLQIALKKIRVLLVPVYAKAGQKARKQVSSRPHFN
jgi:hypothetical protein